MVGFELPGDTVVKSHLPMQEAQEKWVWSLGRKDSPRVGNGNPLQYSCLENSMDRGAWWATVQGVAKSQTHYWATEQLLLLPSFTWQEVALRQKREQWGVAANVDKASLPTHLLPCNLVPNRPETDTGLWPGGGEPCPRGLYPPSALSCTPSVLYPPSPV